MSEIKIFRIVGTYILKHKKYLFRKEVRALKEEDALENVMCQVTSIGILRRQIKLREIKEITFEECDNLLIHELAKTTD